MGVEAGHGGSLATQERTTRSAAALGDPRERLFRQVRVLLPHGEVVEEDQGFGPLHHQVVHDHRDAVDPHDIEAGEEGGELQLGADAVGSGDEDRFVVALGGLEEAGEAPYGGEHLGPEGPASDILHPVDEAFVLFEVHAGASIARRARGRGLVRGVGVGGASGRTHYPVILDLAEPCQTAARSDRPFPKKQRPGASATLAL